MVCNRMFLERKALTLPQSVMEMNGGSVVAMIGKNCVAIATDLRLGNQAVGVAMNFEKVSAKRNANTFQVTHDIRSSRSTTSCTTACQVWLRMCTHCA